MTNRPLFRHGRHGIARVGWAAIAVLLTGGCGAILGIDKEYEQVDGVPGVGEGGTSSTDGDNGNDGGPSGGDGATTDSPADGPVAPPWDGALASGDLRFYYARSIGDLWYRTWSRATKTWGAAVMIGQITPSRVPWVRPVIGPGGSQLVGVLGVGAGGGTVELRQGAAGWPLGFSAPDVIATTRVAHRGYDLAYGASSGAAMVVYSDGTPIPKFRTRASGTWTSATAVLASAPDVGVVDWVKLVSHPRNDEITLVYSDSNQKLYGAVWNGTTWSAVTVLDATPVGNVDFMGFAAAYESLSGDALVFWNHPSTCGGAADAIFYSTKPAGAGTFTAAASAAAAGLIGGAGAFAVASEPGTDRIAFSAQEWGTCCVNSGCNDWGAGVWDGTQFAANSIKDLDGTPGVPWMQQLGSFPVGVGFVGGDAIALYSQTGVGGGHATGALGWAKFTGGTWTLQTPAPMTPVLAQQVNLATARIPAISGSGTDNLVVLIEDINGSVWAKLYDGTSWSDMNAGASIADNVKVNEGMAIGLVAR